MEQETIPASVVDWVLRHTPTEVDKALERWLTSSLRVGVRNKSEMRFPEGAPAYSIPLPPVLTIEDRDKLPAAIAKVQSTMFAPAKHDCEQWIARLEVACAGGQKSLESQNLRLDTYSGAMVKFPADVAKAACEELALKPRGSAAWFPTLPELMGVCERLAAPRKMLLAALQAEAAKSANQVERERLEAEAKDWLYAVAEGEAELTGFPRPDPDRQSEIAEFIDYARKASRDAAAKARALGVAA